jgi:predicted ribosomally synthesized peptide with nif11-like leader
MSAKRFLKHLQSNTDLQASLSRADWSIEAVVKAGTAAGFVFTGDEYREAYRELAAEELAFVSGAGAGPTWKKLIGSM